MGSAVLIARPAPVVAAAVMAVFAALLLAAPASADHHRFRVGVADGALDPEADIRRMATADVKVFRTLFSWPRIERERGTHGRCDAEYDWSYTNRVVREAGRRGVDLLPFIAGTPPYVPGGDSNAPRTSSPAIEDYKCFVSALARRYGRRGTFLAKDAAARPIKQWQVWNEPNLPHFAPEGGPAPRDYARLVKITRKEISRHDPRATIVLAGVTEFSRRGMDGKPFLQRFYRVKGIKRNFDALSVHPYARDHRGVKGAMIRMQDLLASVGDRRRSVWITETGWAAHPRVRHFVVKKTERGQARQLRKTFKMLRSNRKRFNLGTVAWFRWRDTMPRSRDGGPFEYAGLYLNNGKPKRSCRAFTNFTGGRCRPIKGLRNASRTADAMRLGAQATAPSPEE